MLLVIYSGSTAAVATIFSSYAASLFSLFGIRLGAQIQNLFALLELLAMTAHVAISQKITCCYALPTGQPTQ